MSEHNPGHTAEKMLCTLDKDKGQLVRGFFVFIYLFTFLIQKQFQSQRNTKTPIYIYSVENLKIPKKCVPKKKKKKN